MKTTRIILFATLFFSEVVSSEIQVNLGWPVLRNIVEHVAERVEESIGGEGFADLELFILQQLKIYSFKRKLLAKVDKQELVEDYPRKCYFFSLEPETVQKVRDALKGLDVPDFFVEKMLILGKKHEKIGDHLAASFFYAARYPIANAQTKIFSGLPGFCNAVPYAILINNEFLVESSPFVKQFTFLHEAGHAKSCYLGIHESSSKELREVIADTYALDFFARNTKKDNFKNLLKNLDEKDRRPKPYLSREELVYHEKKLFDIQQRENELDVPIYAQKIVVGRKKNGYKQEIRQECRKLLDSTYDKENNPNLKDLLQKSSL